MLFIIYLAGTRLERVRASPPVRSNTLNLAHRALFFGRRPTGVSNSMFLHKILGHRDGSRISRKTLEFKGISTDHFAMTERPLTTKIGIIGFVFE